MPDQRWVCSMIGAREHYAVPRALHSFGALQTFFTDAWAGSLFRRFRNGPAAFRAFASRYHPELPLGKVISFTRSSIWDRMLQALDWRSPNASIQYLHYLQAGQEFALRVNAVLKEMRRRDRPCGFFGYSTGSLETLELF